jgi:hypothetical protein
MAVLPKKGDTSYPKNFRAIMVGDFDGKIFQIILNDRLSKLYEQMAPEHSNGFRPGRGTSDSLFIFLQTLRKRKEHNTDSWVLLIDVIKAFDGVPRSYLWAVMEKMGVDPNMMGCLKNMYEQTAAIMVVDGVSKTVDIKQGTGQGSVLGPKLFAFYMLGILEVIERETILLKSSLKYNNDEVMTGRQHTELGDDVDSYLFGFADDTALIFNSKEDLQCGTQKIISIFEMVGLGVHTATGDNSDSKTSAMFIPTMTPSEGGEGGGGGKQQQQQQADETNVKREGK